jgi:hypothetical protein
MYIASDVYSTYKLASRTSMADCQQSIDRGQRACALECVRTRWRSIARELAYIISVRRAPGLSSRLEIEAS